MNTELALETLKKELGPFGFILERTYLFLRGTLAAQTKPAQTRALELFEIVGSLSKESLKELEAKQNEQ